MKQESKVEKQKLELTKVSAFEMQASVDEWKSEHKGYYKDRSVATQDAKGAGWYGSNGTVHPITLYTDGAVLYEVTIAGNGKFKDEDSKYRQKTIDSIKSKLSAEELELLGIK